MTQTRLLICLVLLPVSIAACGKRPPPAVATAAPPPIVEPAPPAPPPPSPPQPVAEPRALSEDELFARKTLAELNAEMPLATVLFDLDSWTLRDDARTSLQASARWLTRWPTTRVTIEGHCDERGTAEYNLALGDRRATAVQEYLASLGVAPDRLLAISKGKESPACTESTDGCWQQNRRGQFLITAK